MSKENIELRVGGLDPISEPVSQPADSRVLSDELHLRRLGKRPLLKRSFGFMSILGFSCSALITWEGILVASVGGLMNGGPSGVVYGFLTNWIGMLSVFAVLAELSSMAPTAGGQYHWVAMMAPKRYKKFLSYLTGWLTTAGWQCAGASTGYLLATIVQGMILMTRPTYVPKPWHTMLILWAIMSFALLVNSTTSRALARFEGLVLVLHLVGFFCVLIPMVYLAPHSDPKLVFETFINLGGWNTQGLSFFVGLPASAVSLIGGDSAVHMSEEIQSASTVVPRALMWTIGINGTLGFSMLLAMLFCIGDLEAALGAQATVFYPFLEIFQQAVRSNAGACVMASILLVMGIASAVGLYASGSRMLWSFSRDRGLPGSKYLVKLSSNSLPLVAVFTSLVITMLLSLIVLGSSVAFGALTGLSVAALFSSYIVVSALLLWCRVAGKFHVDPDFLGSIGPDERLVWGPWRVPEPLGTINNVIALLYLCLIFFWSFWPPQTPVTPESVNFACLVFGSVVLFSIFWYFVRARHFYKGPIREVD